MKSTTKVWWTALVGILLCFCLMIGSTFALFLSEKEENITINSGKVEVFTTVENIKTKQLGSEYLAGTDHLSNGSAQIEGNTIALQRLIPGDGVSFDLVMRNESNVGVKYRLGFEVETPANETEENSKKLFSGLQFRVEEQDVAGIVYYRSAWKVWEDGSLKQTVVLELPESAGAEYMDLSTLVRFSVEAVQGNADVTEGEIVRRYEQGTTEPVDGVVQLEAAGVKVQAPAEAFETGTKEVSLTVEEKPESTSGVAFRLEGTKARLFDIRLSNVSEAYTGGAIRIAVPVEKEVENPEVYCVTGGALQVYSAGCEQIDGRFYVVFSTSQPAEYVVASKVAMLVNDNGTLTAYGNADEAVGAVNAAEGAVSATVVNSSKLSQQTEITNANATIDFNGNIVTDQTGNLLNTSSATAKGLPAMHGDSCGWQTMEDALEQAVSGETITLLQNVSWTKTNNYTHEGLVADNVTVDLNGHTMEVCEVMSLSYHKHNYITAENYAEYGVGEEYIGYLLGIDAYGRTVTLKNGTLSFTGNARLRFDYQKDEADSRPLATFENVNFVGENNQSVLQTYSNGATNRPQFRFVNCSWSNASMEFGSASGQYAYDVSFEGCTLESTVGLSNGKGLVNFGHGILGTVAVKETSFSYTTKGNWCYALCVNGQGAVSMEATNVRLNAVYATDVTSGGQFVNSDANVYFTKADGCEWIVNGTAMTPVLEADESGSSRLTGWADAQ